MSSSHGLVRFDDGVVMYFTYNGTADVCHSHLYRTETQLLQHWKFQASCDCKCAKQENVDIWSTYGGGFGWSGKACRECCLITHGLDPYDDESIKLKYKSGNGKPDWVPHGM